MKHKIYAAAMAAIMLYTAMPHVLAADCGGIMGGADIGRIDLKPDTGTETVAGDGTVTVTPGVTGQACLDYALFRLTDDGTELPISGCAAWTVRAVNQVPAGTACEILELSGDDARCLLRDGSEVKLPQAYLMANLPDLIPSMVFDDTNSYGSLFRSSGENLDTVTGEALYDARAWDARLGRDEYMMPMLLQAGVKLCAAQQEALKRGRTLVLYEAFRPYETQMRVKRALDRAISRSETVRKGISGWDKSWFIAQGRSNHQQGIAVDIALAEIKSYERTEYLGQPGIRITEYELFPAQSAMHELSKQAASLSCGISSRSRDAWRAVPANPGETPGAAELKAIMTGAGFTPLASEWWHFNDLDALDASGGAGNGRFYILYNMSEKHREPDPS